MFQPVIRPTYLVATVGPVRGIHSSTVELYFALVITNGGYNVRAQEVHWYNHIHPTRTHGTILLNCCDPGIKGAPLSTRRLISRHCSIELMLHPLTVILGSNYLNIGSVANPG
jgi:hypothetical protein